MHRASHPRGTRLLCAGALILLGMAGFCRGSTRTTSAWSHRARVVFARGELPGQVTVRLPPEVLRLAQPELADVAVAWRADRLVPCQVDPRARRLSFQSMGSGGYTLLVGAESARRNCVLLSSTAAAPQLPEPSAALGPLEPNPWHGRAPQRTSGPTLGRGTLCALLLAALGVFGLLLLLRKLRRPPGEDL